VARSEKRRGGDDISRDVALTADEIDARARTFQAQKDALARGPDDAEQTPGPAAGGPAAEVRKELAAAKDHISRLSVLERYGFPVEHEHFLSPDLVADEVEPWLASEPFLEGYRKRREKERVDALVRVAWAVTRQTQSGAILLEPTLVAAHLHEALHTVSFNEKLHCYRDGVYHENKGEVQAMIKEIADAVGCREALTKATREVLHHLTYTEPCTEYPFNRRSDLIPVANGVIRVDYQAGKITREEHAPEHRFTFKLPVVYDPAATPDAAVALLEQYVVPEDVPLLFQIFAQALLQMPIDRPYKKAYLLQGEANAGKTTYIKIADGFFGKGNISRVSLQAIGSDKFAMGKIESKLLNSYDDLSDVPLADVGTFKAVTGDTWFGIERKFQQGYDGRIFAVHLFTCNRPPRVPDDAKTDAAFWERWEYIRFPYVFPVDPDFFARTLTPGFFSSLLAGVLDYMLRIRKDGRLTVNRTASEVMQRWTIMADPLYQFIDEKMERLQATMTDFDKDKLWAAYLDWCDATQVDPRRRLNSMTGFTRSLIGYGIAEVRTTTTRSGGKGRVNFDVYRGPFRWKNANENMGH
jgi:phage/plasmid-associated DNA primase